MEQISAAGNLTIEVSPDQWRLVANGNGKERVLIEAAAGQPLRYPEIFASKRRLPEQGSLPVDNVQRVVLGWSHEDESWHLGLLLGPEIALKRGSRWCEIARWPDPETNVFSDVALQAGRSLARTITRPFNLIEPQTKDQAPTAPPPALRSLPLNFDLWTLEKQNQNILEFILSPRWARGMILRIVWYALLIAVYLILSIVTLEQIIALPKPEFLPYLGLVTAIFLIFMILYTFFQLITKPSQIDVTGDGVIARRGNSERWNVSKKAVQAVYVSEIVNKKGTKRVVYHGEINLLLQDGGFRTILEQPHSVEDPNYEKKEDQITEAVFPLNAYNAHSDLQMAGLYVAQALGVECRYDRRVK